MAKITWSNPAVDDLEEVEERSSKISEAYSRNLISEILDKPNLLRTMPEMGRIVPEKEDPQFRELFVRNYRIIYRYEENIVEIVRVISSSRHFF